MCECLCKLEYFMISIYEYTSKLAYVSNYMHFSVR